MQCWKENGELCNCGTSSEGFGVEYIFKDWDGKILKKWSIEEWATPTPPADPTREATAQYTYTFAGWDPEVEPIGEDTVYTATYSSELNYYDITITFDGTMWSTDIEFLGGNAYGEPISANGNVLTVWEWYEATEITATPNAGYVFSSWGNFPATVTGDLTITATFKPTISNKALGYPEGGTQMFVGPDLYDGSYIEISIDHDQEDPQVNVEGEWIFDPEWAYWESASLLVWAFEAMDPEWIDKWIDGPSWLMGNFPELWTINSECMSLVQAIYNNPTEANQQALITFFEEWDAMEAENPSWELLIIDDEQASRIREGLESAEPEDVQAVIEWPAQEDWTALTIEDYYTYYLLAMSENSADVRVYVWDYMYQTTVSIETDTEDAQVVVGECYPAPYDEL